MSRSSGGVIRRIAVAIARLKTKFLAIKSKIELARRLFNESHTPPCFGVLYAEALRLNSYRSCHLGTVTRLREQYLSFISIASLCCRHSFPDESGFQRYFAVQIPSRRLLHFANASINTSSLAEKSVTTFSHMI